MPEELEKLAYEEALRGIDKQESLLKELRSRATALLATSSFTASLLGQQAFRDPQPKIFAAFALIAFVGSTSACVFILRPKHDLVFAFGSGLLSNAFHIADHLGGVYRQLALDSEYRWASNNKRLKKLMRAFTLAAGAFLLQTFSLVVLLGDTILA
jgi:hypothetical protein